MSNFDGNENRMTVKKKVLCQKRSIKKQLWNISERVEGRQTRFPTLEIRRNVRRHIGDASAEERCIVGSLRRPRRYLSSYDEY